jgi:hypothetical protein
MKLRKKMTEEEIRREGLEALCRELGPAGMARFLQQFQTGHGDFTAEREAWVGRSSVAELAQKIRERRAKQPASVDENGSVVDEAERDREEAPR